MTLQKQCEHADLQFARDDIKKMREMNEYSGFLSEDSLFFLKKDKYKNHVQRFHNYLTKELSSEKIIKEGAEKTVELGDNFKVDVKDREIWINNYLISKPHAVGSNLEFFEYIRSQPHNTKIERSKLPDSGGGDLKEQVAKKGFIKILNNLGFKGQILKAFFYDRSKNTATYRGDKITKADLEKAGLKTSLFVKELELAHIRN